VSKERLQFEALIFDVGGVIVSHDDDMLHRRLAVRCRAALRESKR
jgi:hypothetical protein